MAASPSQQLAIANVYLALFNRAPDASGFVFWTQALANGASLAAVTGSFVASPEARAIYPASQTADQFVSAFYQTVFGRTVDAGGLTFWTSVLNSNGGAGSSAARADLVSKLVTIVGAPLTAKPADLTDAQYAQTVADRDLFAKKGVASLNFALNANSDDLNLARQIVAAVGAPPVTPDPGPPVDPLLFTTGIDALTGTAGNDTFTADNSNAAARKLTSGDSVDGGLGIDTVRYRAAAGDTGLTLGTFNRVEKLYVTGGAALTADVHSATSLTELEFDAIGGALNLTLAGTQTAVITANNGAAVQNVRLAYGATDTSASVVLKGSGKVGNASTINVTGAALTTLSLSATGGVDSVVTFGNNGLLTLNLSGDANLSVSESIGSLTTIDASTATGNTTITHTSSNGVSIKAGSGADAITGGAGDDVISFAAGRFTAADSVDGGAGRNTLQIGDTAPTYALINAAANISVLALGATGATVDIGQVATTIQAFTVANTGTTTFTNAKSTSTFVIGTSADVTAVNIANLGGQTTADISLVNSSAVPGFKTLGALAVSGATSISLTSSGTSTNVITTLTAADGATITVKGAADLMFSLAAGTASGSTINASTFTGKLTVTGSNFSDTMTGSNGADVINGGGGSDVINGGAGADVLSGGLGNDEFILLTQADTRGPGFAGTNTDRANIERITDWQGNGTAAGDTIRIGANHFAGLLTFNASTTAEMAGTNTSNAVMINTLGQLIAAVAPNGFFAKASDNDVVQVLQVDVPTGSMAGTYVFINDNVAGLTINDTVISVAGGIVKEDFVFA